jgi:hypothetical protein
VNAVSYREQLDSSAENPCKLRWRAVVRMQMSIKNRARQLGSKPSFFKAFISS